ncbi:MAG: hypothetical protein CL920_39955 [Deltaproteobacteria bacterium]|nr:hypothetical protein [Deltaproteobacteria bacterium]
MIMRDCVVHSGAFCEDTSATAPGAELKRNTVLIGKMSPPSILQRMERKGEEPKAQGDGEVC